MGFMRCAALLPHDLLRVKHKWHNAAQRTRDPRESSLLTELPPPSSMSRKPPQLATDFDFTEKLFFIGITLILTGHNGLWRHAEFGLEYYDCVR